MTCDANEIYTHRTVHLYTQNKYNPSRAHMHFFFNMCAVSYYTQAYAGQTGGPTDTGSSVGTSLKSIPSVHLSPYLTNSLEPAKCGSQLFHILRLSLDLALVQQIVSLCVRVCVCLCVCVSVLPSLYFVDGAPRQESKPCGIH